MSSVGSTDSTDVVGSDLLTRLAVLEDKEAIREHTAYYNRCFDDGLVDEWVETFTADGVFQMPGAPDTQGRDSLRTMIRTMLPVGFVHMTVNHDIRVSADQAEQSCYVILAERSPSRAPGSSRWMTTGRYRDTLRRTAGGWRFQRRIFAPDSSLSGLPQWW